MTRLKVSLAAVAATFGMLTLAGCDSSGNLPEMPDLTSIPTGIIMPSMPSVNDALFAPLYDLQRQLEQQATALCNATASSPTVTGLKGDYKELMEGYRSLYNMVKQTAGDQFPSDLPAEPPSLEQAQRDAGCEPR